MTTDLNKIKEHLEYLGFDVEEANKALIAKQENDSYLISQSGDGQRIFLNRMFRADKGICDANKLELLEILNDMNRQELPIMAYHNEFESNTSIVFSAYYFGEYDKSNFGKFFTSFRELTLGIIQKYMKRLKKFV